MCKSAAQSFAQSNLNMIAVPLAPGVLNTGMSNFGKWAVFFIDASQMLVYLTVVCFLCTQSISTRILMSPCES
jgi:hypothetical protein